MDANLKKRWVKALRSGKYEQGEGCLRFGGNAFCCLGVLADVIDPDGWEASHAYERVHRLGKRTDSQGFLQTSILSSSVQKSLSEMNDRGRDFDEIADYIEKRIKGS